MEGAEAGWCCPASCSRSFVLLCTPEAFERAWTQATLHRPTPGWIATSTLVSAPRRGRVSGPPLHMCMATHTRRATQSVARRAAVLSFGLSSEYSAATKDESKAPNADRSLYSR